MSKKSNHHINLSRFHLSTQRLDSLVQTSTISRHASSSGCNIFSFLYPLSNTPAVCLTQDLPPEEAANILLLGCGDVRNILYTAYAEKASRSRQLDITCCDAERAILARNILLFTLFVDDVKGLNVTSIWNIYYHLFLDAPSLELLQAQSKKLYRLASSMDGWHCCQYGKILRFSDSMTLKRIRGAWSLYFNLELAQDKAAYDGRFKASIQRSTDAGYKLVGSGAVLTGFRSAAPISIKSLLDLPEVFKHFWDHGVTDKDPKLLSKAKHSNPMFASLVTDTFTLHYGTDPVLGFHLATAYASLTEHSPLNRKASMGRLNKLVAAARFQFQAWAAAFREKAAKTMTIRFFVGDALGFAHTSQHQRAAGRDDFAHWYRTPYRLEPIVLDGLDYSKNGKAPLSFNVIDTSNLSDHLGALNLLVATSPLLINDASATLYTESLVKVADGRKDWMQTFLGGHFPTVSILLGSFPVEYWTNSTAVSNVDDTILESMPTLMDIEGSSKGQMRTRLVWKRQLSSLDETFRAGTTIRIDEQDLAKVLHKVYQEMFRNEDLKNLFSKMSLSYLQTNSCPHYHRGSFASFLGHVRSVINADWRKVMSNLLHYVEYDSDIMMGRNYIQELYLYLHILDLCTVETFRPAFNKQSPFPGPLGLESWKNIPSVVCITLNVPREYLKVFTDLPLEGLGTPNVNCTLQSADTFRGMPWQNVFAAVQLTFGTITTSNQRNEEDFRINVVEDESGWTGNSPLLVSFYAPTWVALLEPSNTALAPVVQSTPLSSLIFLKTLRPEMRVYDTTLVDHANVFITKYLPNQSGYPRKRATREYTPVQKGSTGSETSIAIIANVGQETLEIVSFIGKVDFLTEKTKSNLCDQSPVETVQQSACTITIIIGKNRTKHNVHFPVPINNSRAKIRIARKSSYVEATVPVAFPKDNNNRLPHFMHPLIQTEKGWPMVWNMPYLNLGSVPVLDIEKQDALDWLVTHISLQFSARERKLRDASMSTNSIEHKDVRTNFKDGIFSMFMHFSNLQGGRAHVFGLTHPTGNSGSGIKILILVSRLLLDTANHTVVLDAAVLPLTDRLMPRLKGHFKLFSMAGMCTIMVDDDELKLWKELLPCYVERCRDWSHLESCEYLAKAQIPLSTENNEQVLCSCGNGKLPSKFISDIPLWRDVLKYAVRAAVSPSFSVPFVEPTVDFEKTKRDMGFDVDLCGKCRKSRLDSGVNLLICSRCRNTKDCSVDCQRADWKTHKKTCGK